MKAFNRRSIPTALALTGMLAYGLLIPWMGFYWDDWPFAWILHFKGPVELMRSFFPFDPLIGPVFFLTSSLLGGSTLVWQIFGLLVRMLVSIALLWSLNQVWPKFPRQVAWVAFFFLVYPGYGQQWVAFTHANQEWISFGCFILSLGVTARSVRAGSPFKLTALALALQAVGLMTTEYFLGLEVLRPLIIYFALESAIDRKGARAWGAVRLWLAGYVEVWLLAGVGQFLFHRSPWYGGHPIEVENPLGVGLAQFGLDMFNELVNTLTTAGFSSWTTSLGYLVQPYLAVADWLLLGLVVFSLALLFIYLSRVDASFKQSPHKGGWAGQAMLLGLAGIVAGRGPSLLAGMPVSLKFDWDRLLISMMLGASLLVIGLLDYFVREDRRKIFLVSLLVAVSIGGQFHNANSYRRAWATEREIFQQLAWRIPALKPGTALVTHELPIPYVSDFQLTALLNWTYAPSLTGENLPYVLLYTKTRLGGPALPKLTPGLPTETIYRTLTFHGSTSDMVVIYAPADGCLRVLDPVYGTARTVAGLNYMLTDAIPLSNPDRIETGAGQAVLPAQYFGVGDEDTWCYFYEKAELARQSGDWDVVSKLYKQAQAKGYGPRQPGENLIFIESFARAGDPGTAAKLASAMLKAEPSLCPAVREILERVATASPKTTATDAFDDLLDKSPGCK